jgi:hypothetical protein
VAKLHKSRSQFPERAHVVGVYGLGKRQRLIALLREAGYDRPLYLHGALAGCCALYETFGVELGALKAATGDMNGPGYSRKIEDVVENAFTVPAETRLLVVEGNYLLLATAPWWRVKPLLARAIYIGLEREIVRARLMKRHAEEGLFTEERNRAHIERTDLPNYDLVVRSKPRADIAIELVTSD